MYNLSNAPLIKEGQKHGLILQDNEGLFLRRTVDTVVSIKDGKPVLDAIWTPNTVFSDEKGRYFIRTLDENEATDAERAEASGIGYIINRQYSGGGVEAIFNGQKVDMPKVLTNEFGVSYKLIEFKNFGLACRNLFGYVEAKKVEPVYLISEEVGTKVSSVPNGVNEHAAVLKEGEVLVQNAYHGERYKQKRTKLEKGYLPTDEFVCGYQVWRPKEVIQQWAITDENIVGPLWGSFEFLAKAAVNITDHNDVYGCNYDVFAGNDVANGSHEKLRRFLPANPMPEKYARELLGRCMDDSYFAEVIAAREVDFVEVPLGVCRKIKIA